MNLTARLLLLGCFGSWAWANEEDTDGDQKPSGNNSSSFVIEGKILIPDGMSLGKNWQQNTKLLANYGEHIGFVR